jgi:MFS transporter, YNFM family, putative membrane transport protein
MAGFAAFLDLYATQPLLPLLMRQFNARHFDVSLTVTAATAAVAFAAPVVGRMADIVGRKRVIVGSAMGLVVATALVSTSTSLTQFVFWRFVQGLMTPGVFAITIAYIQDEWPSTHVGRASGAYVAGTVTGGFTGRVLVGLVSDYAGWKVAFLVLAGLNAVAATALALWLPEESVRAQVHPASHARSMEVVLRNRRLLATDLVGFCVLFVQVAVFTYVTFYLADPPFHLGTAALSYLFVVFLVGASIVPFAGRMIDARGYRTTLSIGIAVGATGALLTLMPYLPVVALGLALVGTGGFIAHATASSYIGIVTPRDRGLAVGFYSTAYYIGGSLGGTVPALMWNVGGWVACVLVVVLLQAVTIVTARAFWTEARTRDTVLSDPIA